MKRLVYLLILSLSLTFCKEKPALGQLVVLNKGVSLMKAPFAQSEPQAVLEEGKEYKILKIDVPDEKLKNRVRWYQVEGHDGTGFVSYDDERLRPNIYAMFPSEANNAALITETAPLYGQPLETAKQLKRIKVNALVDVISIGKVNRPYGENEYDKWVRVKSGDKTGFVFATFLMMGEQQQLEALKKAGYKQARGWVKITTKTLELVTLPIDDLLEPKKEEKEQPKTKASTPAPKKDISGCLPRDGQYVPVNAQLKYKGRVYYHVQASPFFTEEEQVPSIPQPHGDYDYNNCYSVEINGWVSAEKYKLIDNFFTYSQETEKDLAEKIDAKLLALLKEKIGPHLNLRSLAIETIDLYNIAEPQAKKQTENTEEEPQVELADNEEMAHDDETFFIASGYQGPSTMFQPFGFSIIKGSLYKNDHRYLVQQTRQGFRFLGNMPAGKIIDLNDDANPELVVIEQNRGGSFVSVFTFAANGFTEVKGIDEQHQEMGDIELVAPYIVMKGYNAENEKYEITRAYEFKKGRMRAISRAKLKALSEESNTSG